MTPEIKLVMDLYRLQSTMLKLIDSQLSIHGISFTEFMVMYQLNKAHAQTMRRIELAESVGLSASGVTRLLLPMEKIGLVQKQANPRDARVSLVKLSTSGMALFEDALESFAHGAESFLKPIDEEQVGQFLKLTEKVT